MDHPVAQHHRPTIQRLTTTHPTRQPGPRQEKLGRPAALTPATRIKINHDRTGLTSVHPWIQAKEQTVELAVRVVGVHTVVDRVPDLAGTDR